MTTAFALNRTTDLDTPALLYYEAPLQRNLDRIIATAGGADKLWPHVKSHKCPDIVRLQQAKGIERFKCATIAEAEMLARCGARHILLAYPLAGPAASRFVRLQTTYPGSIFYAIADSMELLALLNDASGKAGVTSRVLLDADCGMRRTGLPLDAVPGFFAGSASLASVRIIGIHAYDGNHNAVNFAERQASVAACNERLFRLIAMMREAGVKEPLLVAGGSPSFPCHVNYPGMYYSPGTAFLMDWAYRVFMPDQEFAAAVATRVISHPAEGLFTLDLGYKGIAADPPGQRGVIAGMEETAKPVLQNEEHWVFRMEEGHAGKRPPLNSVLYVIPTHICPTTALYPEILLVRDGSLANIWSVAARNRRITI